MVRWLVRVVTSPGPRAFNRVRDAASRHPAAFAAAGVAFLAAVLRVIHVDYGLPHIYFWDEPLIMEAARKMIISGKLWPESFYRYPSAIVNVQALGAIVSYFRALGASAEFVNFADLPVHRFYLLGRLISVAFGVAAVAFTYLFAARIWRRPWWGVAGGALLAVSNVNIAESRQIGVDIPVAALVMAGVYFLFRYREKLGRGDLLASAALLGLAVGTKYIAAYFLPAAFIALALWRRPARDFLWFAVAAVLAFFISTPGALFRMRPFLDAVAFDYWYYEVHGHESLTTGRPWAEEVRFYWNSAATYVPALLTLAGIWVVLRRWRGDGLAFLLFPAAFALGISRYRIWTPRMVLDFFPLLALFFGAALGAVAAELRRRVPRPLKILAPAGLVAAAFIVPAWTTAHGVRAWGREDPRTRAANWVHENVPWPAVIVEEVWNKAPRAEGGETDAPPVDEVKYEIIKVDCFTRKPVDFWASKGAIYYIVHVGEEGYYDRAQYRPGSLDGARGDLGGFWRNFERVAFFEGIGYALAADPVSVYRLKDDLLVERHPYRRSVPLRECTLVTSGYPHKKLDAEGYQLALYNDCRVGCFFTAPHGDYKVGFRLNPEPANGIPPRVAVLVDGERVANFDVWARGIRWTENIPAAPTRYHHLVLEYYNDTENLAGGDRNLFVGGIFVEPAA
ncbi:MAG: phospholipid carrier-dependent glycosyltransferase [candidate division Zixibacteria bacterium]|nr:phospholipid carrier-dependent glycosyltransferase [candidate division Zixibacteria bacterium]